MLDLTPQQKRDIARLKRPLPGDDAGEDEYDLRVRQILEYIPDDEEE